jgi:MFS family permease
VISSLFVTYLVGAFVTPFAGRWIDRAGSRRALAGSVALGVAGGALTLFPSVAAVGAGLALSCTAAFVAQAASTSFLQVAAPRELRSAASGVYVSAYYLGGSAGGVLPAAVWHAAGWTGCVSMVALVQLATLALALRFWRTRSERAQAEAPLPVEVASAR